MAGRTCVSESTQNRLSAAISISSHPSEITQISSPLPSANGTRFIGDDLNVTGIVKSTYTINLTGSTNPAPGTAPVSCNGGAMGEGYFATADPPVTTDMRYFGTNTSGTLYYNLTNQVSVTDLTAGNGTPLQ